MVKNLITAALIALTAAIYSPLAAQQGEVFGLVFDGSNGEPIRGATVQVEGLTGVGAVTDLDGVYRLNLDAGIYTLIVKSSKHLTTRIEGVTVVAGETADGSAVMSTTTDVTTVDVVATVDSSTATAEALVAERRLAPVVSDGISSDDIRSSAVSDAAAAAQKVTGVSIVEGGYVYVRGLGERYSSTMLNNAVVPTTEPERRGVPLDLFPAALLNSVKILKTYSPNMPGEFSGGLVKLETTEFPTRKNFTVGMTYGFNSRTTFDDFDTFPGGSRDFFGFDDGSRDLPDLVPTDDRVFPGRFSPQELQDIGRSFSTVWEPETTGSIRPSVGYSIAGGNTWGKLGLVGAITFQNKPQRFQELQRFLVNAGSFDNPQTVILTDFPDFTADQESTRLGAVLNLAYRLTPNDKLVWRNTLTHESEKEARTFRGRNGRLDGDILNQRLRWIERDLFSTGVEGEHVLPSVGNSLLRWQYTYSTSGRDEPDLREIVRTDNPDGSTPFLALPQSATRFFSYMDDRIHEPRVEWATPFYAGGITGQFEIGFRGTFRSRDFQARRFRFVPLRLFQLDLDAPNNELLGPDNITPDLFQIRENTRGTDQFDAEMDIYAGYAMVDLSLSPNWRLVGGLRIEDADIQVVTLDPLVPGSAPVVANLTNRDPLPAINVIYSPSPKQNYRVSYSKTVSRPDFRELSPFDFVNVLGGFSFAGNPDLVRAKIDNFDLRWEYFFGGNQLFAVSYFFKDFSDPIETTIQPTTGDLRQTFFNAQGATNQGIELEYRRNLGFLSPALSEFGAATNFTFVDSEVDLGEDQRDLLTTLTRPLAGQSRYIFNFSTEWARPRWRSNARFDLNYTSSRLTDVGSLGLPDIIQGDNLLLDFVYKYDVIEGGKWSLRFTAENLTDNRFEWVQGGILQRAFRSGRTYSIGTSYSF